MMPHAPHNAMIRKGKGEGMVGPEGVRKAPGTGLISLDMAAPWGAEIGPNGFNRLAGECPTKGENNGRSIR
jgi:hypothetical protein